MRIFVRQLTPFDRAIEIAQNQNREPVIFPDSGDNPGGGGTGRTTQLLAKLVEKGVRDVLTAHSLIKSLQKRQ